MKEIKKGWENGCDPGLPFSLIELLWWTAQ